MWIKRKFGLLCISVTFLLFQIVASIPAIADQLIQPNDFEYLGAFRLPDAGNWGSRGMAFRPEGDSGNSDPFSGSLIVTGHDHHDYAFEVTIPVPLLKNDLSLLPEARLMGPTFDATGGAKKKCENLEFGIDYSCYLYGLEYIDGELIISFNAWYNTSGMDYPNHVRNKIGGGAASNALHIGKGDTTFHSNKTGDYIFSVPKTWANQYLGGRNVLTGRTRPAGAFNSSQGPSLFAFSPGAEADAIALMYFDDLLDDNCVLWDSTHLVEHDPNTCPYPDYRPCDSWDGGAWLEVGGKRTIVLSGTQSLGKSNYIPGTGYSCGSTEPCFTLFDPAHLEQVAAGKLKPWQVRPYAEFRPSGIWDSPFSSDFSHHMGGMAVDLSKSLLYLIQKVQADPSSNVGVVHVYRFGKGTA